MKSVANHRPASTDGKEGAISGSASGNLKAGRDKRHRSGRNPGVVFWLFCDAVMAFGVVVLAYQLSPYPIETSLAGRGNALVEQTSLLQAVALSIAANVMGLQSPLLRPDRLRLVLGAVAASWIALAVTAAIVFGLLYEQVGRYVLLLIALIAPLALIVPRILIWRLVRSDRRRVLLLGEPAHLQDVEQRVAKYRSSIEFVGRLGRDELEVADGEPRRAGVWRTALLSESLDEVEPDEVVDALGVFHHSELSEVALRALSSGIAVSSYAGFIERNFLCVPVKHVSTSWFVEAGLELSHPVFDRIKRSVDVVAAVLGMVLSAPFVLVAALGIWLTSRGGVLYSQVRVGQFGRQFVLWKLRSMTSDAEAAGVQWAAPRDSRVTLVGRILRKTRLDEVPQFWNVLRGDMSLVGPRPERPEFVEALSVEIPFYEQRHLVRPGLTGWAQINYPYGASVEDSYEKLCYDLYYVKNESLGLDLQIILRTVGAVMKGAR